MRQNFPDRFSPLLYPIVRVAVLTPLRSVGSRLGIMSKELGSIRRMKWLFGY